MQLDLNHRKVMGKLWISNRLEMQNEIEIYAIELIEFSSTMVDIIRRTV